MKCLVAQCSLPYLTTLRWSGRGFGASAYHSSPESRGKVFGGLDQQEQQRQQQQQQQRQQHDAKSVQEFLERLTALPS